MSSFSRRNAQHSALQPVADRVLAAPKSAENKLSQNGQNALEDDVRATDQKPILTAAGARVRYHVPLGDNVDRDGLKEGWNHDCGAAARAS